tara:strand:- start:298 stop:399 length:102 start_codon:yes stop_codon:yes gene_type:complete
MFYLKGGYRLENKKIEEGGKRKKNFILLEDVKN